MWCDEQKVERKVVKKLASRGRQLFRSSAAETGSEWGGVIVPGPVPQWRGTSTGWSQRETEDQMKVNESKDGEDEEVR